MTYSHVILLLLYLWVVATNPKRPLINVKALAGIGVVFLTTLHVLPDWANGVAAIVVVVANIADYFFRR